MVGADCHVMICPFLMKGVNMASKKNVRNKNAKLLFNPYRAVGKTDAQNELAVDKYGFIPTSVWHIKKSKQLVEFVNDTIGNGSFNNRGKDAKKGERELSLFNPDEVYRIIKFWTKKGDTIVAPYGSRGVIGLIAYLLGRNSYSNDVVPEYMDNIKSRFEYAKGNIGDEDTILEAFLCDAVTSKVQGTRTVTKQGWKVVDKKTKKYKSEVADCVIFNPPYFDVERYTSVDGQLSDIHDYEKFLEQYAKAIEQHYRILKHGGFAIAVVNDFRKDGVFYNFHGDTINICKEKGFLYHDIVINQLNGQSMQAIGSFEKNGLKIMAKSHEYILVFRKPDKDGESYRDKWK